MLYLVWQQLLLSSRSDESCTITTKESLNAPSQKAKVTPSVKEGKGQEYVRTTFRLMDTTWSEHPLKSDEARF
jgi:hypothetical protein